MVALDRRAAACQVAADKWGKYGWVVEHSSVPVQAAMLALAMDTVKMVEQTAYRKIAAVHLVRAEALSGTDRTNNSEFSHLNWGRCMYSIVA